MEEKKKTLSPQSQNELSGETHNVKQIIITTTKKNKKKQKQKNNLSQPSV